MKLGESLRDKKITVIGAGVSGSELALLASRLGARAFVSDCGEIAEDKKELFAEAGIAWETGANTARALDAGLVVVSSGISPDVPIIKEALAKNIPVQGELDFVYPYLSGQIIAVTGSNGKTTTASMTGFFLSELGYNCLTGGNIGNAIAKAAGTEYEYIVLELSSFQLHWAERFRADVSIVTNLAPDHIDWHGSYAKYAEAKANVIRLLKKDGTAIYQERDRDELHAAGGLPLSWGDARGADGIYMDEAGGCAWLRFGGLISKLFDFRDTRLLGKHNMENTAMALAALRSLGITVPAELTRRYTPPGHRCAYAGEAGGVIFVDDSKGTNVAASVTAMGSLPNRKVVILGGKGKGEDYAPLAEAVKEYAAWAVLLGEEREKIAAALAKAGYKSYSFAADMDEAVEAAYAKAEAGQTVLLSPACTSWDMYPNYGARGDHFTRATEAIIKREGKVLEG